MSSSPPHLSLEHYTSLRRTFAIISHPDAGKTTLTEKLLLYSGMVRTAGMVRGRKGSKATSSDWMGMEQERGISITASAMQFPYKGVTINVLDTPGHQDFSEDTYRTLTAADSAIMVIDAAKGVEEQTRKLFAVCALCEIPVLTFINKMDLPSRDVLDLLSELEEALGIKSSPYNWPIGYGKEFCGVVNCTSKDAMLFKKGERGGATKALSESGSIGSLVTRGLLDSSLASQVTEELELLEGAGNPFSKEAFLKGKLTPVFFGSALTNYGVEPFFDQFVDLAPSPRPYTAVTKNEDHEKIKVNPITTPFSGYVFKIQANMNPRHRDSMAFIRVCSGKFERDMTVFHHRLLKEVRVSRSYAIAGQDRDTVDEAYPGDVVGLINPGVFSIGDTVSSIPLPFQYPPLPQFPPEITAYVRPKDVLRKKSFDKGIVQLTDEGAVQLLRSYDHPEGTPLIAAVGKLQFEVLQYRLREEYNVDVVIDYLPYRFSSYVIGSVDSVKKTSGTFFALDQRERVLALFSQEWEKSFLLEHNKELALSQFLR
jgi:peptide chain release factor 3